MVFLCQEVNTIVGQSTSLQKLAVIRHCKQEGLQPSLAAMFKLQAAQLKMFYCFVLTLALLKLLMYLRLT